MGQNWIDGIQFPAKIVLFRYAPDLSRPRVCADQVLLHNEADYQVRLGQYQDLELSGGEQYVPFYHDLVPVQDITEATTVLSRFLSTDQGPHWTGESTRVSWRAVQGMLERMREREAV